MTACELNLRLRVRGVSAPEVLAERLDVIAAKNPALNAIVTFTPELALDHADAAGRAAARSMPFDVTVRTVARSFYTAPG